MNSRIVEILTRLMVLRYLQTNDDHRKTAYEKVINNIKKLPHNLSSANQAADEVPGVGHGIKNYIAQIFSSNDPVLTGISEIDNLLQSNFDLFNRMANVAILIQTPGIGIKKGNEMYNRGETIAPNTGWSSSTVIEEKRIPYTKIALFEEYFRSLISDLPLQFVITGSFRRKKETSGDIDILIHTNSGSYDILQVMPTVIQRL